MRAARGLHAGLMVRGVSTVNVEGEAPFQSAVVIDDMLLRLVRQALQVGQVEQGASKRVERVRAPVIDEQCMRPMRASKLMTNTSRFWRERQRALLSIACTPRSRRTHAPKLARRRNRGHGAAHVVTKVTG